MSPPDPLLAYVHFPWCLEKCPYCDFVSYKTARAAIDHDGYADAIVAELEAHLAADEHLRGRTLASVFFGGGTPSLWEPGAIARVLGALSGAFAADADLEVTVECNPTSLDGDRARALVDAGVGRLSIGVQALRDEQLRHLGRLHDTSGATRAVTAALGAGVPRVSADLIFGLPGQPAEDARDQALALADLGLRHLSCYQLTIESGTRFGELARRGRLPLADEGAVADAFLAIDEALASRGLEHYEISNYARPGEESRHNLGYWRGLEYVGLGCGAVGRVGARRTRNVPDPARYTEAARAGDLAAVVETEERLPGETLLRERIMLGLRIAEGLDLATAARELGVAGWTAEREREAARLVARGRLERHGDRLRVPRPAWLYCDDTAARLF